jgi:hypothetical protein
VVARAQSVLERLEGRDDASGRLAQLPLFAAVAEPAPPPGPTLLELAGLRIPEAVEFKSLLPVLKNPAAGHRDHLYFAFMSWQRAVQDGRHKLIEYCVAGKRTTQLFDLRADPDEMRNLAGDPANEATLQRLRKLLESERKRLNDGNTPYPFTDRQGKEFWQGYEAGREKPGGG